MTVRDYLLRRYRAGMFPFIPCMVGIGWVRYFGNTVGVLSGAVITIVLAAFQLWITRASFRCPRCHSNLWTHHAEIIQGASNACPYCGLRMNETQPK